MNARIPNHAEFFGCFSEYFSGLLWNDWLARTFTVPMARSIINGTPFSIGPPFWSVPLPPSEHKSKPCLFEVTWSLQTTKAKPWWIRCLAIAVWTIEFHVKRPLLLETGSNFFLLVSPAWHQLDNYWKEEGGKGRTKQSRIGPNCVCWPVVSTHTTQPK